MRSVHAQRLPSLFGEGAGEDQMLAIFVFNTTNLAGGVFQQVFGPQVCAAVQALPRQ